MRLTLGRLKAAFEMAVDEGKLVRNVVKLVTPPEYTPKERDTWSKAEVRKFLRTAAATRLHAAWRLSLYGLRRGEVLGLRWSDIDLKARTLTVSQARVLVDYKVRIEEPKSHNGKRTLPLDDDLVASPACPSRALTCTPSYPQPAHHGQVVVLHDARLYLLVRTRRLRDEADSGNRSWSVLAVPAFQAAGGPGPGHDQRAVPVRIEGPVGGLIGLVVVSRPVRA